MKILKMKQWTLKHWQVVLYKRYRPEKMSNIIISDHCVTGLIQEDGGVYCAMSGEAVLPFLCGRDNQCCGGSGHSKKEATTNRRMKDSQLDKIPK